MFCSLVITKSRKNH